VHITDIRRQLRDMLPPETFDPQPRRGAVALIVACTAVALIATLWLTRAPWFVLVPASVVLSQMWAHATFAAHESIHGAGFESRFWREVLCYAGFAVFGFGPEAWRAWHMRAHHAQTNHPNHDPDVVGIFGERVAHLAERFTIGSGRWWSASSLFTQFSLQGQHIQWSRHERFRSIRCNRARARLESAAIIAVYSVAMWQMGAWYGLWLLVIPGLLVNATLMSYICTQHFLRPLSPVNDPLANTLSVRTHWLLDTIHLHFSHHREHHLFPSMSHGSGPAVRAALHQLGLEPGPRLSHFEALRLVLRTPRMYSASHTLVHHDGQAVTLHDLWRGTKSSEVALIDRVPQAFWLTLEPVVAHAVERERDHDDPSEP
jgi:fatty acid desaturase